MCFSLAFYSDELDSESEDEIEETESEVMNEEQDKPSMADQKSDEEKNNMLICLFLFTVVWSLGGVLKHASREKFDAFFRELCDNTNQPKGKGR